MALMSGAEALVRCLLEEGVQRIFGIPGDQCNPITDAILRVGGEKGMKFVTARHEEAAARKREPHVSVGSHGQGSFLQRVPRARTSISSSRIAGTTSQR